MTSDELQEEINIEIELIEATLQELLDLSKDVAGEEPSIREKTAAAAFMAQFYSGIENILKRISYFNSVPLPADSTWHVDLFKRFCAPLENTHQNSVNLYSFNNAIALSGCR